MSESCLSLQRPQEGLVVLQLQRAARMNAMDVPAMRELKATLDALAADLSVSGNDRQFVIGVYLLTGGIGALVPGALADRFGRRPILLGAVAAYIALAILSALAPTYDALIAVRAAQGFFAAGIIAARAPSRTATTSNISIGDILQSTRAGKGADR